MKYATALIAAAVGAQALHHHKNGTLVTTEVVDQYVTYCPGAMKITHGHKVYTMTKPGTLTITDCPCTITRPVLTTSTVICHDNNCSAPTSAPTDTPVVVSPTGGMITPSKSAPSSPPQPTSGAGKVVGLSGAALAGIVGLAAFIL
ncbi:hypothetical protein E4U55_006025 [Claviceps digitariae]|nr:hypothetical protein E4U55_006025 [Claviceps digitariae]